MFTQRKKEVWRCLLPPAQHQEKKGAFFWKRWVKVVLKFLNFSVVPTWPRDLKYRIVLL